MKKISTITTITIEMFTKIFSWSLWYIGTIIIIHLILVGLSTKVDNTVPDLVGISYTSSWGSALVISIIAAYTFMSFYIKHGITRREFYIGYATAGMAFSASTTILFQVVNSLEGFLLKSIIAKNIIKPVGFCRTDNIFLIIIMLTLTTYLFYLLGWTIFIGYYRFRWLIGFAFIGFVILVSYILNLFWEVGFEYVTFKNQGLSDSVMVSIVVSVILIGCMLIVIRQLTKKIAIKL